MSKELLQQNIEKAQIEINRQKGIAGNGKMRQCYHFMPQTGWLNDPNGLIFAPDTQNQLKIRTHGGGVVIRNLEIYELKV